MKNKKGLVAVASALAAVVIIGAVIFLSTHVTVDGERFAKDAEVFDLTDHALSVEAYQQLCAEYPNTRILWTVPFQGSRYPTDTQSLTVTALTEEEIPVLDYLPQLQTVDATGCTDYAALLALQQHRPECRVLYSVRLCGTECGSTATELTVQNATAAELEYALPLLPQLSSLTLEGTLPQPEELLRLKEAFPGLAMHYTVTVAGNELPDHVTHLDFSDTQVTADELTRLLPLLDKAEEVILTGTPLTDAELVALIRQFPDIFFLCTLDFAGLPCSTDATEIDLSGRQITVEEADVLIPCFPRLETLDMSHCGIDNEAMDALNRRHPDVAVLWTLKIGWVTLRTDATVFYPAAIKDYDLPKDDELQKLRYCTEMIAIDIGHSDATHCEWVRYMPHLKYLILADTKISDLSPLENARELLYLEVFSTKVTDYTPLLGCTSLQNLNIGDTFGDPEPLTRMDWLHFLAWHGAIENPELEPKARDLENQLTDTVILLESPRNIGGTWRGLPHYYVFREIIGGDFFNQDYIYRYWGYDDGKKIIVCDKSKTFAADVLAEIVRSRIDNGQSMICIRNIGSEKAEILYQSLLDAEPRK